MCRELSNAGQDETPEKSHLDQRWWPSAGLAEIAASQDGLLTLAQLRTLRVPDGTRRTWLANGRLTLIAPAVYALGHGELSDRGWRRAGLMTAGADAALAHVTALEHREIGPFHDRRTHLIVPRGSCGPRSRFVIHRTTALDERDVQVVAGLRTTTVARALIDLAGSAPFPTLAYACRQAEFARALDITQIELCLSRLHRPAGIKQLRRILAPAGIDGAVLHTNLEQRTYDAMMAAGFPDPITQQRFDLRPDHKRVRVDFWFPQARLVVEADGPHHRLPLQRADDRLRDAAFARRGILVVRVPDDELDADPMRAIEPVAEALRSRWSS